MAKVRDVHKLVRVGKLIEYFPICDMLFYTIQHTMIYKNGRINKRYFEILPKIYIDKGLLFYIKSLKDVEDIFKFAQINNEPYNLKGEKILRFIKFQKNIKQNDSENTNKIAL